MHVLGYIYMLTGLRIKQPNDAETKMVYIRRESKPASIQYQNPNNYAWITAGKSPDVRGGNDD